jgi:hypothetical protein
MVKMLFDNLILDLKTAKNNGGKVASRNSM